MLLTAMVVQLQKDMVVPIMLLSTSVRGILKPNAIQPHGVYTKHCRPVPKTVCDNADQMFLQPSCVPSSRKVCSYYPEEKCENVPKQHCHKIPYQVKKMECSEDYGSTAAYEAKLYQGGQDYSIEGNA